MARTWLAPKIVSVDLEFVSTNCLSTRRFMLLMRSSLLSKMSSNMAATCDSSQYPWPSGDHSDRRRNKKRRIRRDVKWRRVSVSRRRDLSFFVFRSQTHSLPDCVFLVISSLSKHDGFHKFVKSHKITTVTMKDMKHFIDVSGSRNKKSSKHL